MYEKFFNFQAQLSIQILKMSLFAGRSNFEKNVSEIFFIHKILAYERFAEGASVFRRP